MYLYIQIKENMADSFEYLKLSFFFNSSSQRSLRWDKPCPLAFRLRSYSLTACRPWRPCSPTYRYDNLLITPQLIGRHVDSVTSCSGLRCMKRKNQTTTKYQRVKQENCDIIQSSPLVEDVKAVFL